MFGVKFDKYENRNLMHQRANTEKIDVDYVERETNTKKKKAHF